MEDFYDAIFELANEWTDEKAPRAFANFLRSLFHRIANTETE